MSQSPPERWLIITDHSVQYQPPSSVDAVYLYYQFSDLASPDGLSAWKQDDSTLSVASGCRLLRGGFRQQALNRLVAQLLLKKPVQAVVLVGLYGCTVDLPRIFSLFNVPLAWLIQSSAEGLLCNRDDIFNACLADALAKSLVVNDDDGLLLDLFPATVSLSVEQVNAQLQIIGTRPSTKANAYDYSLYEFSLRDHPLLCLIQEPDVKKFTGCKKVLDLGCGAGIFVSLLQEAGIDAVGVERNTDIVSYGRGMGLNIIAADALEFLVNTEETFDGIYCSHFVEHLPIDVVQQLLTNLARVISDNGVVVLAFPDPESIRSQLLGFWRDPEHVRFYHPELILSLAQAVGLDAEWTSYQDQPHKHVSFTLEPPSLSEAIVLPVLPTSEAKISLTWLDQLLSLVGLGKRRRVDTLAVQFSAWQNVIAEQQKVIARQQQIMNQLTQRTDQLWAVNNTWAWNDNAVLKLRRRKRCP